MRRIGLSALAGWVLLAVGCASSGEAPAGRGGTTSDGALLTLEARETGPVWRDLTPAATPKGTPTRLRKSARAFDYWEVRDGEAIDEVWSALFSVLNAARNRSGSESRRRSLQLLLEAIEPAREGRRTRMDVTFMVSKDDSNRFEGVACRLYRNLEEAGVSPKVTILFLRRPKQSGAPRQIWVWGVPSFERAGPLTVFYRREEASWGRAVRSGLSFPVRDERPDVAAARSGRLEAKILTDSIWKRFAGRAYARTKPSSGSESPGPPDDVRPALGMPVRDRRIRQVYSDTKFPPRADLDEL